MAGMARTWWGKRFLDVLEISMDSGRLRRGRAYSGPGRLLSFDIAGHTVNATMRGNVNPYFGVYKEPRYEVTVRLKRIAAPDWDDIAERISHHAAFLSQLLMNEMPAAIEDAFAAKGANLLPRERADLIASCSCPDYASPCKHVAGVYYKIASLLDRDPLLLFQLRGMKFEKLRGKLAASPLGQALIDQREDGERKLEYHGHRYTAPRVEPLSATDLKSFWKGGSPPPSARDGSCEAASPAILVKRGGDYPGFWNRNNSFIEAMELLYTRIVNKNKASL